MTHPATPQTRAPLPAPRIAVRLVAGRLWTAQVEGAGQGSAWGAALGALDFRSHAVTNGYPCTWWISEDALRALRAECGRIGVRVEAVDGAPLPTAAVR
jgi:hypothetical protein